MVNQNVYIIRASKFLPNLPISNDQMELYLGMIEGKPSKARPIVLRSNGITNRYYAITKDGISTHTNAQLSSTAIKNLFTETNDWAEVELLAAGTTSPDQLLPSHAAMIHGEFNHKTLEIHSVTGACCAGIQALKYAYLSIHSGQINCAVSCGSEKLSTWMLFSKFQAEHDKHHELHHNPILAFEKEFLRWMLSDGASAFLLKNKPEPNKINLKIDWIEIRSYANEMETCMYAGATKNADGSLTGFSDLNPNNWHEDHVFSLKQDVRLLGLNIVKYGGQFLEEIIKRRQINIHDYHYFLPHLSSEFFRDKIQQNLAEHQIEIPNSKWFTNLSQVGNVGSASMYLMIEELLNTNKLKIGEKILIMVPESARFSYAFASLTVV